MFELKDINRLLSESSEEKEARQEQVMNQISEVLADRPEGMNAAEILESIEDVNAQEALEAVWRLISRNQAHLNDDRNLVLGESPYPEFD